MLAGIVAGDAIGRAILPDWCSWDGGNRQPGLADLLALVGGLGCGKTASCLREALAWHAGRAHSPSTPLRTGKSAFRLYPVYGRGTRFPDGSGRNEAHLKVGLQSAWLPSLEGSKVSPSIALEFRIHAVADSACGETT